MICFHKYSNIQEDGYQYCERCGKAKHTCSFIFEKAYEIYSYENSKMPRGEKRIYKCKVCGKIKVIKI